jgi:hypothetical protein
MRSMALLCSHVDVSPRDARSSSEIATAGFAKTKSSIAIASMTFHILAHSLLTPSSTAPSESNLRTLSLVRCLRSALIRNLLRTQSLICN